MIHAKILEKYKRIFIMDAENIDVWHPNGFGSIRIRFLDKREEVFTYTSDRQWSLETLEHFIERMNKNKLNGGK